MLQIKKTFLLLCLLFLGAFCYTHGMDRAFVKEDGIPIEIIESASSTKPSKTNSIIATINGHSLSVPGGD